MIPRRLVLCGLVLLVLARTGRAQCLHGGTVIEGTIGNVPANARPAIVSDQQARCGVVAEDGGRYRLIVPAGRWLIRPRLLGYCILPRVVSVTGADTVVLDFRATDLGITLGDAMLGIHGGGWRMMPETYDLLHCPEVVAATEALFDGKPIPKQVASPAAVLSIVFRQRGFRELLKRHLVSQPIRIAFAYAPSEPSGEIGGIKYQVTRENDRTASTYIYVRRSTPSAADIQFGLADDSHGQRLHWDRSRGQVRIVERW